MGDFDEIRQTLLEWGISETTNGGPHSWRCEHVDRFGECDCLDGLTNDIIRALERNENQGR